MTSSTSTVVIGIGNDYRRDDAVGLYVARRIADFELDGVTIIAGVGDGSALIDIWDGKERCFVIDCACSRGTPGAIYRFDASAEEIPAEIFTGYSTHNISIVAAASLAEAVARLPESLIVYGIEGGDFTAGVGLSHEVELAAERTVELVLDEITKAPLPI